MALTDREKNTAQRACEKELGPTGDITYTTTQLNAAMEGLDAKWESAWQAEANTEIDTAGAFRFSAAQKDSIRRQWLVTRAGKE